MNGFFTRKYTVITAIGLTVLLILPAFTISSTTSNQKTLNYQTILNLTIEQIDLFTEKKYLSTDAYQELIQKYLTHHPDIHDVKRIHKSITITFNDGYQLVLLNPQLSDKKTTKPSYTYSIQNQNMEASHSALLLNPFAYAYGTRQCRIISRLLNLRNIDSTYIENEDVNLQYIEQNLSHEIIYYNTHAGYWEINSSQKIETVVIATAEEWTNDTPTIYSFEYANNFIVEGVVGKSSYIAFTPALIDYYYNDSAFNNSFIYMATCYALYDESMASIFLDKEAEVYVSWTKETVFWTNSLASIWTFRLLSQGRSIDDICDMIGSGGFYNWLFGSKLNYLGNGDYTLN